MYMQVNGVAPWPLDGGAELIAGEHSIVKQLADNCLPMHTTESEFANFVHWSDTGELTYLFDGLTPMHDQITMLVDAVRPAPFICTSSFGLSGYIFWQLDA